MKYHYDSGKSVQLPDTSLCFLFDHEFCEPGKSFVDNVAISTASNGLRSMGALSHEPFGSGGPVVVLNDLDQVFGDQRLTMLFKNGDFLENVPISQETISKLFRDFKLSGKQ
tara:strand:+ start:231 stop:566 length:336 start_codon:yes stop_codon:yes gene_type:complete